MTRGAARPALAITMGDPAGIGPEVIVKALGTTSLHRICAPFVVGDRALLSRAARALRVPDPFDGSSPRAVLIEAGRLPGGLAAGRATAAGGRASALYIETAVALALGGVVRGIVTAPINKIALARAGVRERGHTELLGRLCGTKRVAMLFWSPRLAVALFTIHEPLEEAIRRIRRAPLLSQIRFVDAEWRRLFGGVPRIAVAALNPHAGEGGLMGKAEVREIAPAVRAARRAGVRVTGPWPADTIFRRAIEGEFDLVLALTHDQGLIPIKLIEPRRAVNVTLGLPFVRTSVDHGTAYDIAGKGRADPSNLVEAVRLAARLAARAPRQ